VVFTTPAIRALRHRFPDAFISYIVEPHAAPIVAGNPHLSEVIVAPRERGLRGFLADLRLGRQLRAQRYDLAIDFHGGPRASLLTWLSGAPRRIGYQVVGRGWMYTTAVDRPRELRARHSVENQWDLLRALDFPPPGHDEDRVEMIADPVARADVDARLVNAGVLPDDRIAVVHVSAGNPFRRWPIDRFVALVADIARSGRPVVVTSGPSEREARSAVVDGARAQLDPASAAHVVSCGEFSLTELRALLDRAAVFIGGDSGPLHIAATTNAAIVGLYGPTLPERSAPWRSPALPSIAIDAGPLPCRPCDQRVCAPGDFRCLGSIPAERVAAAALRLLKND